MNHPGRLIRQHDAMNRPTSTNNGHPGAAMWYSPPPPFLFYHDPSYYECFHHVAPPRRPPSPLVRRCRYPSGQQAVVPMMMNSWYNHPASMPTMTTTRTTTSPTMPMRNRQPHGGKGKPIPKRMASIRRMNASPHRKSKQMPVVSEAAELGDEAVVKGVTERESGKWQAQMYFAGRSRYIGVFDTRREAAHAYCIFRNELAKASIVPTDDNAVNEYNAKDAVTLAREASFMGVVAARKKRLPASKNQPPMEV